MSIEANQPCRRTKKLFIGDLLSNGLHEKVMICYLKKDQIYTQFVKKILLAMIIGQQMKEEELEQNY